MIKNEEIINYITLLIEELLRKKMFVFMYE